jgi:hypothetical protein
MELIRRERQSASKATTSTYQLFNSGISYTNIIISVIFTILINGGGFATAAPAVVESESHAMVSHQFSYSYYTELYEFNNMH